MSECNSCQAYRLEMKALDDQILRALSLNVPELNMPELPDIETSNVVSLSSRRRFSPPTWFAMAATVVVAVDSSGNASASSSPVNAGKTAKGGGKTGDDSTGGGGNGVNAFYPRPAGPLHGGVSGCRNEHT